MANHVTDFSTMIKLNVTNEDTDYSAMIKRNASKEDMDAFVEAWYAKVEGDDEFDWGLDVTVEESGIWISADDNGNIDAATLFIEDLLEYFDLDDCVMFEWATYCNRPILDAFAGGGALVNRSGIVEMINPYLYLTRYAKENGLTIM